MPRFPTPHLATAPCVAAVVATLFTGCASTDRPRQASGPDVIGPVILGSPPLCEASAAVRAPWDPGLILVADNEISDRLFTFRIGTHGLLEEDGELMIAGDEAPEDLEGLAKLTGQVVLVGSHGRGGSCTAKPMRQRMLALTVNATREAAASSTLLDTADIWQLGTGSVGSCLEEFFVTPLPPLAKEFCQALVHNEHPSDLRRCRCFDIEGAAGVTDVDELPRLWIGLRQPRVDGRAVLLRMASGLQRLQFDRVVLIPANRGIRGLAEHDGQLWAILGPAPPLYATSCLWRAPLNALHRETVIEGEVVIHGLPPASEGMVFSDGHVVVVIDGEQAPAPGAPCAEPARQIVVPLP